MNAIIDDAIQYVRENKTWSDAEERVALDKINSMRCDLSTASDKICCDIHDLMEEWSDENDYPEGWWMYYVDEDDIFLKL